MITSEMVFLSFIKDDTLAAGGEEGKVEMFSLEAKKQVHTIVTDTNRLDSFQFIHLPGSHERNP